VWEGKKGRREDIIMDEFFTISDLTELRRWTPLAITRLLGEPDAPGGRYLKERVKEAEETDFYKQERERRRILRSKAKSDAARVSARYSLHLPAGERLED
jgi:hypothetical protein